MRLSIIICTYKRANSLVALLECIRSQTYHDFETLVIDGSDGNENMHLKLEEFRERIAGQIDLKVIRTPAGLTRQRNRGLQEAQGDVVCFFDDDVTFESDFLFKTVDLLSRTELRDVGGMTGYDIQHYPQPISLKWRFRRWLRGIPSLKPGDCDYLGRAVPLSFALPFSGCQDVKWLPGFCMIYRRDAIANLRFDECLPARAGEDRDFSMAVSRNWRLIMCGDLELEHHSLPQGRDSSASEVYQSSFGASLQVARHIRRRTDIFPALAYLLSIIITDIIMLLARPSKSQSSIFFARVTGMIAGYRAFRQRP